MLNDFKQQYIDKCLNGSGVDDELNRLFESVLESEFNGNPVLMDEFIQSIIKENQPRQPTEIELLQQENAELRAQYETIDGIILELMTEILPSLEGSERG